MSEQPNPDWWKLKDSVKARCCGRCEYCDLRPVDELHHRTYARHGQEHPSDVMAVCRACHRLIHGNLSKVFVRPGSLADSGDRGTGITKVWLDYLKDARVQEM